MTSILAAVAASAAAAWALTAGASTVTANAEPVFTVAECPDSVAAVASCHSTRDSNGAWLWVAVPKQWNKTLIVHAHGGPSLSAPELGEAIEDMQRFDVFVRNGYAWVSSTYRRGGYGVRMAAADVDHSRELFWRAFGKPARTLLHGQSYGGNVAAKAAELYALDVEGAPNYDGVMLTSGVLAGGTRAYDFRADLRAVYQYYCRNLPATGEPPYPVWQGLPAGSKLTRRQVQQRVDACTGVSLEPGKRSSDQARRLRNILAVTGLGEKQLLAHMSWATLMFRDLVHQRLNGLNPFDNSRRTYRGSDDDAALNAGVERFTADPRAVAKLAYDADLSGLIVLPTVTMHALHDPTISFEVEKDYARVVAAAGRSNLLVQTATDEHGHSKLAETQYMALLAALNEWLDTGRRPSPDDIAATCRRLEATVPGGCRFVPAP
jgi:alpha-beta hydrolase superfamily lysophospholipase